MKPAAAAMDLTAIPAAPGEGCPRCGGKVFSAEEMLSRSHVMLNVPDIDHMNHKLFVFSEMAQALL